jgi:hypothetical protein
MFSIIIIKLIASCATSTTNILSVWLVENGGDLSPVDHEDYPNDLLAEIST